jgi:hypothetical protein
VRRRREKPRKIENVAHRRGAKRINRLGVVTDDGESLAIGLERNKDRSLQPVGVLIFIDQHVIEPRANVTGDLAHLHRLRPVEEQIIVIEYVLPLLGLYIGAEETLELTLGIGALWENWKDPASGEWIRTFAVITTDANELVAEIHDRMPLILAPGDYNRWLSEESDPRISCAGFQPSRCGCGISTRVNKPENDDSSVIDPIMLADSAA